jgi:hypothetical protein
MAGPKRNGIAAKAKPRAKASAKSVLVLRGPNLNLVGTREPQIYGRDALADINARLVAQARNAGVALSAFQSNHEGTLVDRVHTAHGRRSLHSFQPRRPEAHQRRPAGCFIWHRDTVHRTPPFEHSRTRTIPRAFVLFGQADRHGGRAGRGYELALSYLLRLLGKAA